MEIHKSITVLVRRNFLEFSCDSTWLVAGFTDRITDRRTERERQRGFQFRQPFSARWGLVPLPPYQRPRLCGNKREFPTPYFTLSTLFPSPASLGKCQSRLIRRQGEGGEREDMVLDSHMQKKEKYLCKFDPRESPINKLAKGRIIFG